MYHINVNAMKNSSLILFSGVLMLLIACSGKPETTNGTLTDIPEDAIPFEYDVTMTKFILLKGTVNDSLPMDIIFDTGTPDGIVVSDSLRGLIPSVVNVQVGQQTRAMKVYFKPRNNSLFTHYLGSNGAVLSWRFFEGQRLKISFQHTYLYVMDPAETTTAYDSVSLFRHPDYPNYLLAPVSIYTQGKVIPVRLLFDTGTNIFASNLDPGLGLTYDLKLDSSYLEKGKQPFKEGFQLKSDSIGIGRMITPTGRFGVGFYQKFRNDQHFDGLLGTLYMEHFEVILDFERFVLYLKPRPDPVEDKMEWHYF